MVESDAMEETEPSELAQDLHMMFLEKDYLWDGKTPSASQIEDALIWMKKRLQTEPVGASVSGGRLIMHKSVATKDGKHFRHDVFLHFGEYDE